MWPRGKKRYESKHDVQWLVAGLGNPGSQYRDSPHNIGFEVVQELAQQHGIALVAKHDGLFGVGALAETDVALLMPLTFMNLSGRSVKPALKTLGLTPAQLIVVHDEIDLDLGRIQVKVGGGLAGHNGLKSISESLGTRDFVRVRIGVGRPEPGDRRPIADWILSPFAPYVDTVDLRDRGLEAVSTIVDSGVRAAIKRNDS